MSGAILRGDVLDRLRELPEESVHCVVTSPPYWGLRDYGVEGQIGLEATPQEYVAKLVAVFREVRRVLRKDGTAWVNMGDSYAGSWGAQGRDGEMAARSVTHARAIAAAPRKQRNTGSTPDGSGLKPKDLCGIPWRLAFALQDDGWWLRQDIIWSKPNPMPESVTDRCTKAHEYIFLLSKSERYYYDADAIRTKFSQETKALSIDTMDYKRRDKYKVPSGWDTGAGAHGSLHKDGRTQEPEYRELEAKGANKRSVWTVSTQAFPEAHFATFPEELIVPCILAGSPTGGTILDPFSGSGTTGVVALRYHRKYIGIELSPTYAEMSIRRIQQDSPLFNRVEIEQNPAPVAAQPEQSPLRDDLALSLQDEALLCESELGGPMC